MAVTSGFFNSLNGDRKYSAEQMSSIFDGIINDGVFQNVGNCFKVTANTGNTINVATGRAWFNSTWINNDAIYPMNCSLPEVTLNRYDAVVIEVNRTDSVRAAQIKMVSGTAATSPSKPTLTSTNEIHQYAIAYIYRKGGADSITTSDITINVGQSSCPYITGILKTADISSLYAQWSSQFTDWFSQTIAEAAAKQSQYDTDWTTWYNDYTDTAGTTFDNYMTVTDNNWTAWFQSVQSLLSGTDNGEVIVRLLELETMILNNHFYKPLGVTSEGDPFVLAASDGSILLADWSYQEK